MKSCGRAFTLVELLVAVGIIAILVAVMLPELSTARALARSAICRHNLSQISAGFASAASEYSKGRGAAMAYPNARDWPGVPYTFVPYDRLFICPEDNPGDWDLIAGLEYISGYSPNPHYPFVDGYIGPAGKICSRGRRGSDENGEYWEFVFEEAFAYEHGCDFYDQRPWYPGGSYYSDNDGVFRIYDNIPGRGRVLKLHEYTCYAGNTATLFGEGLFDRKGTLEGYKGCERVLTAFYTSYGMNRNCHQYRVAPDTVVAIDFEQDKDDIDFVADPDRQDINDRLNLSGRHLGRINTLSADGSVQGRYPGELYPQTNPDAWSP